MRYCSKLLYKNPVDGLKYFCFLESLHISIQLKSFCMKIKKKYNQNCIISWVLYNNVIATVIKKIKTSAVIVTKGGKFSHLILYFFFISLMQPPAEAETINLTKAINFIYDLLYFKLCFKVNLRICLSNSNLFTKWV